MIPDPQISPYPPSPPSPGLTSRFTAKKEGYYQVNARLELMTEPMVPPASGVNSYVSIAIYHVAADGATAHRYAEGNNLHLIHVPAAGEPIMLYWNNAPNVSDVVLLAAGESIEIWVFHDTGGPLELDTGPGNTYVSVHKIS